MSEQKPQSVEGCKAQELIDLLNELRPKHGAVGSRDVDVTEQQRKIDTAIAILAAPQPAQAQEPLDVEQIIKLAEQFLTLEPSKSGLIIKGGIGDLIEFAHAVRGADQPAQAQDSGQAHRWATQLATNMAWKFYPEVTQWKPLPDLVGVISQIDNMVTGLVRATQVQEDTPLELRKIVAMIVKKFADKPGDYNLSIGGWETDLILGDPMKEFHAYIAIPMSDWRKYAASQSQPAAAVSAKDADYADLYRFVRDRGCNVAWAAIGAGECLEEFDKTIRSAMAQQAGKEQCGGDDAKLEGMR